MSIKTKVAFGVIFLFVVILVIGGLGLYYLKVLSADSRNILADNYESLEYTKGIIANCDSIQIDKGSALKSIERNLRMQEDNVTEKGEKSLTNELRLTLEKLKAVDASDSLVSTMRAISLKIQQVNMSAIVRKSERAQKTASDASMFLIIAATLCILAAFTFIVNFPGYIANPIVKLTAGIKSIANKNYEERLEFNRKDEFEELAIAFNQMAEKLDEYEHSNLAKILSEKKRIETIINRMSDPLIGLDEGEHIIFANDIALNLLDLDTKSVLGKYAPDVAVNNDLLRILIQDRMKNREDALIKAVVGGKENYFSKESIIMTSTATTDEQTVKIGRVIILKNVTPFKELDLAKTNFIATISHELKTPIASMQMGSKLLQDKRVGQLNDEQKSIVSTLSDELSRLSHITNELLDLSQVETGNIKLNIKKAHPQYIMDIALEATRFPANQKHIEVRVNLNEDLPEVHADAEKCAWVLVNFLTNAIRYSPEYDHVTLECKLKDQFVTFSVRDQGPGIESKYIDRIFEKFFQVPGTPSGTGLGLAISKEFIEAQGGNISVVSAPGEGSIFSFQLRVA